MSVVALKAELTSTLKRHDDEITALASKIREELVIPACRRHRLEFVSGNGVFFFACGKGECRFMAHECKFSSAALETIVPILDLLNEEVSHAAHLGYWVEDVRKGASK